MPLTILQLYCLLPVPNQTFAGSKLVKKSRKQTGCKPRPDTVRTTLLITRVSTPRQAANDEGSLVNQLQRLRSYIQYRVSCGESWQEVAVIELRGVSGKDSVRSDEFQPVFEKIRTGSANTVICPALDRVCRSVAHFLGLFEFLREHGVEFISLREQFDTTSPQGRFVATILMALAQLEREITAQRTSEAMADRAVRGLWNGGQLLGYDLDLDRPGYLIPNGEEAMLVNLAFDLYLELGSIKVTAQTLNRRGYRTKSYNSRRGNYHPGTEFTVSSMQYLLKNPAYIGKKQITVDAEAGEERHLVDDGWPAIVSEEKFQAVQRLMADNGQTHRCGASSIQHVYSLSSLLHCKRCGSKMDGESATGPIGKKYFYYRCSNKECGIRVAAHEVEEAILERLHLLAEDPELLDRIITETNRKLQQSRPKLERQQAGLEKELIEVNAMADKLLTELVSMDQQTGQGFIKGKLNELGQRRTDLEHGSAQVQEELDSLDREAVDADLVRATLGQIKGLFETLKPYEQRELMQLVLQRAEVNEREISLDIYTLTEASLVGKMGDSGEMVRMRPGWLPRQGAIRCYSCH
jgi:site-specific DNA recombinase